MILALCANGPGEFAGWMRPLLAALYAREPALDVRVFCLPDDYATGTEAAYVRRYFPQATVYAPAEYVRFALGRSLADLPSRVDRFQYLGGDLMHAARLHDRLGGIASTYKFTRKKDASRFAQIFAIDEANRSQLLRSGAPADRITIVGNLAIDGARGEAGGSFGDAETDVARDGVLFFPGSRKNEVATIAPMFVRIAVGLRRRVPDVPIGFAWTPFADLDDLESALARGGVREAYGMRATLERGDDVTTIVAEGERFPLVMAGMRAARNARLAVAIPGTKLVELATLGVPTICLTPANIPEFVVINGPLQYLGKLPGIGLPLKRAAVLAVAKRFPFFAQPNIDAGREIFPEMRGTLLPSRAASVIAERYTDTAWIARTRMELHGRYAAHVGAAGRMADALLERAHA